MAKINLLFNIKAYSDGTYTNNPTKNHYNWTSEVKGAEVMEPKSMSVDLAPGETISLHDGGVALSQDATTEYSLSLKPGTSSTYILTSADGTPAGFRALRAIGGGVSTVVEITRNGPVATITSSGPAFDFSSVQVGDEIRISSQELSQQNRGKFRVLSSTASTITIDNSNAINETEELGASFEADFKIYSAAGVQIGDKVVINQGFSPASFGVYEITDVEDDKIYFYSTQPLPEEANIQAEIFIYRNSKAILYIETTEKLSMTINGENAGTVEPLVASGQKQKGMALLTRNAWSIQITNSSLETASVFFASAE